MLTWQDQLKKLAKQYPALRSRVGGELEFMGTPEFPGVSGSKVVFLSTVGGPRFFAFKYDGDKKRARSKRSVAIQAARHDLVAKLFGAHHLPHVHAHNGMAILMEYAGEGIRTLVSTNRISMTALERIMDRIYGKYGDVWSDEANHSPYSAALFGRLARNPLKRITDVARATRKAALHGVSLKEHWQRPIIVNGTAYPSLEAIFRQLPRVYNHRTHYVRCQGDPTGDNILIDPAKEGSWQVVDWELAGYNDWRLIVSVMYGWWRSVHNTVDTATLEATRSGLNITYTMDVPAATRTISGLALKLGERVGQKFGEADWREQLYLQLGVLYLGDLRFLGVRRQPDERGVALLGQGIEALAPLLK